MKLRLLLVDAPDLKERSDIEKVFLFNMFPVSIGRGANNGISLLDPTRTVSRNHAQIYLDEGVAVIKDLDSKNFTYLNNVRLSPNKGYALSKKDKIHCGDFILKVDYLNVQDEQPELAYTSSDTQVLLDSYIITPFDDIVAEFLDLLHQLTVTYNEIDPEMRDAMLAQAISNTARDLEKSSEVVQLLAESLSRTGLLQKELGIPVPGDD